jgi:hypothetical protein
VSIPAPQLAWRRVTETEPAVGQRVIVGWTIAEMDDRAQVGFVASAERGPRGWLFLTGEASNPQWWMPMPPAPLAR